MVGRPLRSLAYLHAQDAAEPHADSVWAVSWTPFDNATISISADGTIKRYHPSSGQLSAQRPAHALGLVSLSTSNDGKKALYNSLEGTTRLWDIESGTLVGEHESFARGGSGPAWAITLRPQGDAYAATGSSGDVTVHSADPASFGDTLTTLSSGRAKFGLRCAYSPDGARIALGQETGHIFVFDVDAGSLHTTFVTHAMGIRSLAWSPDSQMLISASEDKRLMVHDVRGGGTGSKGAVASLAGHTSWVLDADVAPDGRLVVSGSADKTIKVWDLATRTAVSTVQDSGEVWSVAWQPTTAGVASGAAFVSGGEDGVVRWWRAAGTA
ncbi:hypothetical protein K488DRAFT_84082 [Vararia minispora EC-137]|uniref:Uncharacterized protein n=1 Tax=Vararia minispora EC-137 TaxID=1314806 RepID=A0ACB8QSG4_9AGAM|nr:hypothetical protein K488DRAFT_84082 [Vararia minispora EC-137]